MTNMNENSDLNPEELKDYEVEIAMALKRGLKAQKKSVLRRLKTASYRISELLRTAFTTCTNSEFVPS